MKKAAIGLLVAFSVLSLGMWVIVAMVTFIPDYEDLARLEFDTLERHEELISLFKSVKKEGVNSQELETEDRFDFRGYDFSTVKKIPEEWVPEIFRGGGLRWGSSEDVLAYFDEDGNLLGIEFFGSRIGCFVSDKATICTAWFNSLHRIYQKEEKANSYYITIIDRSGNE